MKKILVSVTSLTVILYLLYSCSDAPKENSGTAPVTRVDTVVVHDTVPVQADGDQDSTTAATNQGDYQYEPSVSKISGRIEIQSFYGAPGYGSTPKKDKREEVYVLVLDKPINVVAIGSDPNGPETKKNISTIQLISTDINLSAYKNKTVRLTGTFFPQETGHHHTDIMFSVENLEE